MDGLETEVEELPGFAGIAGFAAATIDRALGLEPCQLWAVKAVPTLFQKRPVATGGDRWYAAQARA